MAVLTRWAERHTGAGAGRQPELLAGDGGRRQYYRLGNGRLVLSGPDAAENLAWLRIGRHLWSKGLALPRITVYDSGLGLFQLEDLGDRLLAFNPSEDLYFQAVELLARLHQKGLDGFDFRWCFQTRSYSSAMARKNEIEYFLWQLVDRYLGQALPKGLKPEVKALAVLAGSAEEGGRVLMHRDFQGRNLIDFQGRLWMLDWQGARLGPAVYDLSSLMEETPGHLLDDSRKEKLLRHYLKTRRMTSHFKSFRREMSLVGPVRMMQALGAYSKFTLEGKTRYVSYIFPALKRLVEMFQQKPLADFPRLRAVAEEAMEAVGNKLIESLNIPNKVLFKSDDLS